MLARPKNSEGQHGVTESREGKEEIPLYHSYTNKKKTGGEL